MMKADHLVTYFMYLAAYSVLLPVFFYLKKRENFKNRVLNILVVILVMGGLTDLVTPLLYFKFHWPNVQLTNIEFVIEFILISWLFSYLCPPIKAGLKFIIPSYILLFIFTCIYWQNLYTYQSITHVVAAFVILSYVARYYYFLFHHTPKMPINQYIPFWILPAFYSYNIVNLFIYALSNYFFYNEPGNISRLFWMTHSFIEIIRNILFSIGIYNATQKETSLSTQY